MALDSAGGITCAADFDSGNLDSGLVVMRTISNGPNIIVPSLLVSAMIRPDCAGTSFENGYRTWFYFALSGGVPSVCTIEVNIGNMNKQQRMFRQGLKPVVRLEFMKGNFVDWAPINGKVTFESLKESADFSLTFSHNVNVVNTSDEITRIFFALTYPYTYAMYEDFFDQIDRRFLTFSPASSHSGADLSSNNIYYHRQILCTSLLGNPVHLVTISSYDVVESDFDSFVLDSMPTSTCRRFDYSKKKVVVISSRVHPGETCSSFVMDGLVNLLLDPTDLRAIQLRKLFVFKLVPMLNPDGVAMGNYRCDSRGVNLNRVYLNPSKSLHPSIFAVKALILHYHALGLGMSENGDKDLKEKSSKSKINDTGLSSYQFSSFTFATSSTAAAGSLEKTNDSSLWASSLPPPPDPPLPPYPIRPAVRIRSSAYKRLSWPRLKSAASFKSNSIIAFYIDLHGHVTKNGCFLNGNHLPSSEQLETLKFAKLLSTNCPFFSLESSVFSELSPRDKQLSKAGAGRVAVYKATGLVHCYTIECNYHGGAEQNELFDVSPQCGNVTPPQKKKGSYAFSPEIYRRVGKAIAVSILDYTGGNFWSRLTGSPLKSHAGLRDWVEKYLPIVRSKESPSRRKSV